MESGDSVNNEKQKGKTMIYNDSETIAKIHARGEKLTQAINNALTLAPQVKDALTRFLGKSITDAIKAINANLTVIIESNDYFGTEIKLYYWGGENYTESSHFYLIWGEYSKENTITPEIIAAIDKGAEQLQKRLERVKYTVENIESTLAEHKKLCERLNEIQRENDGEIMEIAGVKSTYYM